MEDNSHRWSELVPPEAALTFAALWDPEDGMITFSGCRLLESDIQSMLNFCELPRDAHDGQSTVFTIDGLTLPFTSSVWGVGMRGRTPTVTFAFNALDDAQSSVDPFVHSGSPYQASHGQAARPPTYFDWSQFRSMGRAIYSVACAPLERSVFRPAKSNLDDTDDSSSSDDFFEDAPPPTAGTYSSAPVLVNLNLKSRFSMTTTSTTGYVDIDSPSIYSYSTTVAGATYSEAWSTLQGVDYVSCPNWPYERGNRLQKPRRGANVHAPADPAEVLARPTYNHVSEAAPDDQAARLCSRRFKPLPKLPRISTRVASNTKASVSPTTDSSGEGSSPETPRAARPPPSAWNNPRSAPPPSFPHGTPPSPCRPAGQAQAPQLRRQKSMAKVVIDSVGRLTSKCRYVKLNSDTRE